MTELRGDWHYPTAVRFGAGRASEVGEHLKALGVSRPLLVTDPGLAELDMIGRLEATCREAGLEVATFSDVKGNPVGKNVDDGAAMFREGKHDGVLAVGGGSALDVGKAVALLSGQKRPLWDFEDKGDNWKRVDPAGVAPILAVPTTAGTGSEVGRSSVITNEDEGRKVIIFHALMCPGIALCDPELTLSLPKRLTAATGMDALSHNLEAYCAAGYHPMSDGIAVEGMRLVHHYLVRATEHPDDVEARAHMLAASLMGATAFQKGLGAMHALSHPIGVHLGQHHGEINAVVMPYVLAFNKLAIADRLERLAAYLGLEDASADGFIRWVIELKEAVGIPKTVADLTMNPEHVQPFADMAIEDPAGFANPVKMSAKRFAALYECAMAGELPQPAKP